MHSLNSLAVSHGRPSFDELLAQVHALGREVLAVQADDVDDQARFPSEAIGALREARLLSAYVPQEYGGMGLNILQIADLCTALGRYCGSTAMIYAMHSIQVACIVHHGQASAYFRDYLRELVEEQRLIASATSEMGTGGDLRSSLCAIDVRGDRFSLTKIAPVISYGREADDIFVTCRQSASAPPHEQSLVMIRRGDSVAEPMSGWDTLGLRGTCSLGFKVSAQGDREQIFPQDFSEILSQTMHPYSHIVWGAAWAGIATDALHRARTFVRGKARKTSGETPPGAYRLAAADQLLQEMLHNVQSLARNYLEMLDGGRPEEAAEIGFAIRANNLKLSCSQRVVEIVGEALLICGISGYRNDSKFSLSRHLRDAYGAAIMVNNDRIAKLSATLLLTQQTEG